MFKTNATRKRGCYSNNNYERPVSMPTCDSKLLEESKAEMEKLLGSMLCLRNIGAHQ